MVVDIEKRRFFFKKRRKYHLKIKRRLKEKRRIKEGSSPSAKINQFAKNASNNHENI